MNISNQDSDIISSLIMKKEMTAYTISKDTGISVPQVQYRINKLLANGIVKANAKENKTLYYVHPAFKSREAMEIIASYIKEIVDVIDDVESLSPDGMKLFISFVVSKTEMSESEDGSGYSKSELDKIKNFRECLQDYAKEKGIKILDVKGWTNGKIEWMALNDRKCACRPDKRVCPCKEGIDEISKKGHCLCNVFGV